MTKEHVPLSLQRRVRDRAGDRCEYCGVLQAGQEATFHVDHVQPRRDGGATSAENLALACVSCSLRKGARTRSEDPDTGEAVALFNPRSDRWEDHFEKAEGHLLLGKTATGRASVVLLKMNRALAVAIRREEAARSGRLTDR